MEYAIAMDIGGSHIRGALVSKAGNIVYSCKGKTEATKGRATVLKNIVTIVQQVKTENKGKKIKGIGMSMSGFVDPTGKFVNSPNYPLLGYNIIKFMKTKFKLPVLVENDANCFALAEAVYGAGKKYDNVIGLIIGTGVGAGIVLNKKIYAGKQGGAGEIGHTMIATEEGLDKANFKKDVEYYAGGKKAVDRYYKMGGKVKNAKVCTLDKVGGALGKKICKQTYTVWGMLLGNIINIFNPEAIVIGGGLAHDIDYKKLKPITAKFSIPILFKNCKIVPQKLGDNSGAIGAAALVFQNISTDK